MMVKVPATQDIIQETKGNLTVPQIRVWCHPHKVGKSGDDYYQVFDSFAEALNFIAKHKEAEDAPLVAFRGYELNLFEIDELKMVRVKVVVKKKGSSHIAIGTVPLEAKK